MRVITSGFVKDKKVLLRYDIDVALSEIGYQKSDIRVKEDFKLKAGLPTLKLCLENASKVIIIGHLGRPARNASHSDTGGPFKTVDDEKQGNPPELSAKPIREWLERELGEKIEFAENLEQAAQSSSKIVLLENIRFFHGEVPGLDYHTSCTSKTCDVDFAHQLASLGEVYVNEAFSSYNSAASTTMVPTLLPHFAGLRFAQEVEKLTEIRDNPKKPFVAIMGGAKVADKLPVIKALAEKADAVLVGGKLATEIKEQNLTLPKNVMIGKLNKRGTDIAPETAEAWSGLIRQSRMIVWNGPLGKFEDPENEQSARVARMVLNSPAEVVVGGGDTVSLLGSLGILGEFEKKGFVSVGGGAMLKFLVEGTLPTIEALG